MIKIATQRLIDSVWTLVYELVDEGKIRVLCYSRSVKSGYDQERKVPRCSPIEEETDEHGKRTLVRVLIDTKPGHTDYWATKGETFEVINPKNIFSYGC